MFVAATACGEAFFHLPLIRISAGAGAVPDEARATADIDGATFVLDWASQSPNDFDLDAARLVLGDSSAVFSDGFD
jgi:hypothetical protein